jgi:hypothetical protein
LAFFQNTEAFFQNTDKKCQKTRTDVSRIELSTSTDVSRIELSTSTDVSRIELSGSAAAADSPCPKDVTAHETDRTDCAVKARPVRSCQRCDNMARRAAGGEDRVQGPRPIFEKINILDVGYSWADVRSPGAYLGTPARFSGGLDFSGCCLVARNTRRFSGGLDFSRGCTVAHNAWKFSGDLDFLTQGLLRMKPTVSDDFLTQKLPQGDPSLW